MEFLVLVISAVVNLTLALVILTRATKASSTAYFGISAFFIAVWAAGMLCMLYGDSIRMAYAGLLMFLIGPMLTTLYMVLFSKHFSGVEYPGRYVTIGVPAAFLVAIATFILTALPTSEVITAINAEGVNELSFQHPWFWVYGAYFACMFGVSYVYLWAGYRRNRGRLRRQLKLVLAGIFATSFFALLTNIALPLIGFNDLVWLGPAWTVFYVITTCYAMVKHGLFDLRLALVLTFTYGLSLTALAVLYYLIALGLSLVFVHSASMDTFSGMNIVIALILAFLFQPIRRFFDAVTSHIFYQDSYSVDTFFSELSRTLASTNDLKELLRRASARIGRTLRASSVSFVVRLEEGGSLQVGTGKYARLLQKDLELLDEYIPIDDRIRPKVLTLLEDDEEELRRMMISHRIAIVLPLVRQGERRGYLFFGEHLKSGYNGRDIRVITTIADELSLAIQNALSVEQIKQLNGHLEQRIDAATKELRISNAQLQRLDEAKDEFISMASHQLRTPLTGIKGYLSMLIEGDVGKVTPEQKQLLNEAFMSSERMVRLIGDFLNVSRLQTGKFVIDKHPTDLSLLVQHELDGLALNAASRDMQFIYKRPKNIPLLDLDEGKIQQVVMNFADNAIYYSKDGSKITVTLKRTANGIEFLVKDKGIGVPEAEQRQLFNKFFRATNARRARPDGTGVGLFLAKKVITSHNGTIVFESKEGKGSVFGFVLPLPKK